MTNGPENQSGSSVWDRLRRRKVVQWGLAYAAGAWGLLQGLQFITDAFDWPGNVLRLATVLLALGFPIAVVLAWYHGDRGHQRVTRMELAIVTLLFLIGGSVFWYYHRTSALSEGPITAQPESRPTATTPADRSIAVLPFVNMSADKEQEYFADGISEELLNMLAQVPGLRVIARTSSFSFKGKEADIATIARTLNVAHVLEGSVRKSGDKLRITAQLIRASDSSNLWSQTYDRHLTDVFAIQDEIAAAVVGELKIKLLGSALRSRTTNPEAYALFLQARHLGLQATPEGYERSVALYQQALAINPGDAASWDGLAWDYINQASNGLRPVDEGFRLARDAAGKALAIDPDYAPGHSRLGWIAMVYDSDLAAAARHFERALALSPTNTDIIRNAAALAASLGQLDTAIALGEYVTTHDPVTAIGHLNLGLDYARAGRLDEAIASVRTALSLNPLLGGAYYSIGVALLKKGEAQAALVETLKEVDNSWRLFGLTLVYHALGRKSESDAALAETIDKYASDSAYNIAYLLAWRNERDRAFEWLEKALAQQDPGLFEVASERLFANLHDDPRWIQFLRKAGKAPEQLAAIEFDIKLPE